MIDTEGKEMITYENLLNKKENLALVGLGYVGLPIAVAFAKKINVIGFDTNELKIEQYKKGVDPTNEVGDAAVREANIEFTSDATRLSRARFIIVAVPTPVNKDHTPDLSPIEGASYLVGQNISKGSVVVFESTVYPGVTEEICVPIIEKESGLKCGKDWRIGYSPERINPGDKVHRLNTITKIVSGMDQETLNLIASVYELVVDAGVYRAESIKVAEAAKVIENSQRDINIAFMNELSIIFHKMNIDTKAVLEAASTKWNFLNFKPGLVGGHCIGIDPYYLTYRAEEFGYHSQVILSGRRINDDMGKYCAENLVKQLIRNNVAVKDAKVAILGFTFKEDCPDTRNTKVIDIVSELKEYGINPIILDPVGDSEEAKRLYGIEFSKEEELCELDAVMIAVSHQEFEKLDKKRLSQFYKSSHKVKIISDLKGILDKDEYMEDEWDYWRL